MAIDMTGYVGDVTEAGVPQPTEERLKELQSAKQNQTKLGMSVPAGTTIPVGMIPPDPQTGIVPTGDAARASLEKYLAQANLIPSEVERVGREASVWSTIYPGRTSNTEVWKSRAREELVKQDALLAMGFDPAETTVEEFLNRPGMATLYQNKVNLFAYGTENPVFTEFSLGSDAIITANEAKQTLGLYEKFANQKKLESAILGVTPGSSVLPTALENQVMDMIKKQMDTNTMYNQQLMDNLKAQQAAAMKAQEVQNRLAQGQSAWQLAKMGALGTTMSGQSYLLAVEQAGLDKLQSLAADYQSKLLEAQKEMNDGNYKSAMEMMNFAMQIEDRISKEKQQQFTNSLKLAEEMRQQEEFNRKVVDWAQEDISNLITAGFKIEDFSNDDKREYEAKAGYPPGTFDKLYDVVKKINEANTYAAKLEADKIKYDILKDIPSDIQINLGGMLESGLKQITPNVFEQVVTDTNGNVKLITYDERSGEMNVFDTGVVSGKTARPTSLGGGSGTDSRYSGASGSIPIDAAALTDAARDLWNRANPDQVIYGEKLSAAVATLSARAKSDAAAAKAMQSAMLTTTAAKIGSGVTGASIKSDAQLYNETITSYFSDPTKNPFYQAPARKVSQKYEYIDGVKTLVSETINE